jgi:hypothetical protein
MTRFIACEDGCYFNIDLIEYFFIDPSTFDVEFFIGDQCHLMMSFEYKKDAQDWLDNFMTKNGLCIEPTTRNRCF